MNANQRNNRRILLFKQQQGVCCWCGKLMQLADRDRTDFGTFEHIIPECHGGTDSLANLLLAHKSCNGERSAKRDRIPLFCWVRRELGTDELKIVKYLNHSGHAALFAPPGPQVLKAVKPRQPLQKVPTKPPAPRMHPTLFPEESEKSTKQKPGVPFDPFARF